MNGTKAPALDWSAASLRTYKRMDRGRTDSRIVLMLVIVLAMALALSVLLTGCGNKAAEPEEQPEAIEDIAETMESRPVFDDLIDPVGTSKLEGLRKTRNWTPDWKSLWKECDEIIGWINCPGTVMDYPITQGTDNAYYLETTYQGVFDGVGTPFADYRSENPFKDFLTPVYGHRMKDGSMFKHLSYYFYDDGEEFYDKYPTYEIYTPERNYELQVFAWSRVSELDGNAYAFELCNQNTTKEQRQEYLDYVLSISWAKKPKYEVTVDDEIMLLSFCTALVDSNREVVWGKLVPLK